MNDILATTKTVIGEARGETLIGQAAVAWVIRNRAEHPRWWGGPSWESVCLDPWQFSCWNEDNPNKDFLLSLSMDDILSNQTYRLCMRTVIGVYDKMVPDPTGKATHYVVSSWLDDPDLRPAWADELTYVAKIGHHTFFTALR